MYFFLKPGVLPPRETARRLVSSSQVTKKSSCDSKVAVITISRQKYSEITFVHKGCPQLQSWDGYLRVQSFDEHELKTNQR